MALDELSDEQAYEAELAYCAGVTGYHRWFFLAALAEALGLRLRAFAVSAGGAGGGERLGVVPLLLRRRGPVSTANYLPVPHIGPVLTGDALRAGRLAEVLGALEPVLLRERVVVTKWSFAPGVAVREADLPTAGFEVSRPASYLVPGTTSVEDYLKGLAPKQRAAIRRGDARGLRAGPSSLDEITRWFPERVSGPYQRQGVAPDYSPAAARALAARLAADPRMLWRSVRDDERVLAVNACIVDGDRLWGWLLAGDRVPGPSPHVAAYWDAITWSRDRGLGCDFGGAPTNGIREFKIAMGGELETCSVAERVRPRAYRAARALHARLASRLASRHADLPGG
jgi:CelD/BcsL family acetyltransferase involved in cellulose biosynthesis